MRGRARWALAVWALPALLALACGQTRKGPKDEQEGAAGTAGGLAGLAGEVGNCAELLVGQSYGYCAAYSDGSVRCWGNGSAVQPQSFVPSNLPTQIDVYGLKQIVLGPRHACGLDGRGQVHCWGDNDQGQVDSSEVSPLAPREVELGLSSAVQGLGLGETQTCAIDGLSHVYCWGLDDSGERGPPRQLAVADESSRSTLNPTLGVIDEHGRVFEIRRWAEPRMRFDMGLNNAWFDLDSLPQCVLKRSGSLWCNGPPSNEAALRAKSNLGESVVQAATGEGFMCALTAEGDVWCEGLSTSGQTGRGFSSGFNDGGWVPGLADVRAIAVAEASACALTDDGLVWCWGEYGPSEKSPIPVLVSGCDKPSHTLPSMQLPLPSNTGTVARLGEAGQARGEAVCWCAKALDGYGGCATEESFPSNTVCLAALAPTDPRWGCLADSLWQEAACLYGQDCSSGIGAAEACLPTTHCGEAQQPQIERFCRRSQCGAGEYLDRRYVCDGFAHCADGSDERNCTPDLGYFECTDGELVPVQQLCNQLIGCVDGSDEDHCQ